MPDNEHTDLILRPSQELAVALPAQNPILSVMVSDSLALAHEAISEIDLDALVREGKRLQYGDGITPNNIQAFNLFQQAANAGHPQGQYELSRCFEWGIGIATNYAEADRWLRIAAKSGDIDAQEFLGKWRSKSAAESRFWLTVAAFRGNSDAQMGLGELYSKKQGKYLGSEYRGEYLDYCKAYAWFRLASEAETDSTANQNDESYEKASADSLASIMSESQMERAQALYKKYKDNVRAFKIHDERYTLASH